MQYVSSSKILREVFLSPRFFLSPTLLSSYLYPILFSYLLSSSLSPLFQIPLSHFRLYLTTHIPVPHSSRSFIDFLPLLPHSLSLSFPFPVLFSPFPLPFITHSQFPSPLFPLPCLLFPTLLPLSPSFSIHSPSPFSSLPFHHKIHADLYMCIVVKMQTQKKRTSKHSSFSRFGLTRRGKWLCLSVSL